MQLRRLYQSIRQQIQRKTTRRECSPKTKTQTQPKQQQQQQQQHDYNPHRQHNHDRHRQHQHIHLFAKQLNQHNIKQQQQQRHHEHKSNLVSSLDSSVDSERCGRRRRRLNPITLISINLSQNRARLHLNANPNQHQAHFQNKKHEHSSKQLDKQHGESISSTDQQQHDSNRVQQHTADSTRLECHRRDYSDRSRLNTPAASTTTATTAATASSTAPAKHNNSCGGSSRARSNPHFEWNQRQLSRNCYAIDAKRKPAYNSAAAVSHTAKSERACSTAYHLHAAANRSTANRRCG